MSRAIQRYQARKDGDESEFGFTLIELLIVIVVLGILAAVTVFALSGTTSKSAVAACNSDAATVNTALQADIAQNSATVATTAPTIALLVSGGYLQSPVNSTHYAIAIGGATVGTVYTGTTVPAVAPGPYSVVVTPTGGIAAVWTPGSAACSTVA